MKSETRNILKKRSHLQTLSTEVGIFTQLKHIRYSKGERSTPFCKRKLISHIYNKMIFPFSKDIHLSFGFQVTTSDFEVHVAM